MQPSGRAAALAVLVVLAGCSGGGGGEGDDPAAFCRDVEAFGRLVQAATEPPETVDDLPEARRAAEEMAKAAERLPERAPEAIAEDVGRLAEVTEALAVELERFYQDLVDEPSRATDADFLARFQPVTEERRREIDATGARVRPWLAEHCGVPVEEPAPGG